MRIKVLPLLIILHLAATQVGFGQISITQQDILNTFPMNRTVQVHENLPFVSQPIDIGQTGGPNIYDFSKLDATLGVGVAVIPVSSIPLTNLPFSPNLTALVFNDIFGIEYIIFDIQPQQWLEHGFAGSESGGGGFLGVQNPPMIFQTFPTILGSSWSDSGQVVESTFFEGVFTGADGGPAVDSGKADGYGTLLLPGGLSLPCLRIVQDSRGPFEFFRQFSYETKSGVALLVGLELTDSTPDTGLVLFNEVLLLGPVSCCDIPGDSNGDGRVNIADVTFVIDFLFKGGSAAPCKAEGDANGDKRSNIGDVTHIISFLFSGGSDPVCVLQ